MKHKKMKSVITAMLASLVLSSNGYAAIYTVTSTADAGAGTLRQAILNANANPGVDIIQFNIAVGGGNLFEGSAPNTYAVIQLNTVLPTITGAVTIDGTTQTNTNPGVTATRTVGVDGISIGGIQRPDIYIVPSNTFVFPGNSVGITGNAISIDIAGVTIRGIAISGFGNTHTNGGTSSGHADIAILRSPAARTVNITITNCFVGCDPTGANPALAHRKTKSNGILVAGHNETGSITNNYIAYTGTYGIHFNGNIDNLGVGPASTTIGNRFWSVSGNVLEDIATNATINGITRVTDGITLMKCSQFTVSNNHITDVEQMGIDVGYNSDVNNVSNNTVTGFVKTTAFQLQAGIRIGLCSQGNTIYRNVVNYNTASTFKAGIWIDRSTLVQTGIVTKDNNDNIIQENRIHNNVSSGIVMSTTGSGNCINNRITRNSIYENNGLGIDLNFVGMTSAAEVTSNDDSDTDVGTNNIQNFPIIDSVRRLGGNNIGFYGKAPAGSTLEFFLSDGQSNTHGGKTLSYGEGKTYIGVAVEGSAADVRTGTASYNLDGSVATNNANLFFITLSYPGTVTNMDSVTATATIANNTSEFAPVVKVFTPLAVNLLDFSSTYNGKNVTLNWKATGDHNFLYFETEYSTDGRDFSKLGTVTSKAVDQIVNYEYPHAGFRAGRNYYRLKMVNSGGKISYSKVLLVTIREKNESALMTNSFFTNRIDLQVNSDKNEEIAVQLYNEAGKLVRYTEARGNQGINFIQVDQAETLPRGIYFLQVKKSGVTLSQKIIKQ